MVLKNFFIPVFLGCATLFYVRYVMGKDLPLTPFGEKVKSLLSDETYNKTYTLHADSDAQLKGAIKKGTKTLYDVLDLPYNETFEEKTEKENEDIGLKNINGDDIFQSQTYALGKCLREFKILNDSNIDEVAQKFADRLDAAAKDVSSADDVDQVITAQDTALGNFLKDEGVTSKDRVEKCEKYFSEELEKHA